MHVISNHTCPSSIQETQEEASQKKREERDAQDFTAPVEQAVKSIAPSAAVQSQDLTLEFLKEKFSKKNKKGESDDGSKKKRKASAEDDAQLFLQSALVGDSSKKAKKEKKEKRNKE